VPCFTCTPGFLLAFAFILLVGNTALLSSLFLFCNSHSQPRCGGHGTTCAANVLRRAKGSASAVPARATAAAAVCIAAFLSTPTSTTGAFSASPIGLAKAVVERNLLLAFGVLLIGMLHRYEIRIPPSEGLDLFGRINNLYQIIAHLGVCLKFVGYPSIEIYGAADDQHPMDFAIMNVLDYAGWLAIFSRLEDIHWLPRTLANTHMSTGMLSLLGHRSFQAFAIVNTLPWWDTFRASFVLTDAIVRSYCERCHGPGREGREGERGCALLPSDDDSCLRLSPLFPCPPYRHTHLSDL
jgi:hypothetical protein